MSRKIYDYNTCYLIAKQCSSSTEMKNLNGSAYNAARYNNWIKDYHWFVRKQHTAYTYEEVYEIAKHYTCSSDFQKGNGSAYGKARANGWIKDYTWFVVKHRGPYTYDECYEIAKKYHSRLEFARNANGAYSAALRNSWLDDYIWFHSSQKPYNYWTKERIIEESKKYKTRGDFALANGSAYGKARTMGLLDSLTWLKDERIDLLRDKVDCVYAYEFTDLNSVYVGRTLERRVKDRDKEHLFVDKDTVSLFASKHNISIPDMKILEDNLTIAEGVEKEAYYVKRYRNSGWIILNRAKTGSIGLLARNKWTKQACYNEALKYKTKTEFYTNSGAAYDCARRHGWLKGYTWFIEKQKPNGFWKDYDNCYNAARECNSMTEFVESYSAAYVNAKKNGWLKDYNWFRAPLRIKKWTYDVCYERAKAYKRLSDFRKYDLPAYDAAKRHEWLKSFVWLEHKTIKPAGYWNRDTCYEEARKYNSSSEFQRNCQVAYVLARKNKWIADYTWFVNPNIKWTYDECKKLAKEASGRYDFRKKYLGAHDAAYRNNWLDDFFPKKKTQ